jgi:hypothetical protein
MKLVNGILEPSNEAIAALNKLSENPSSIVFVVSTE